MNPRPPPLAWGSVSATRTGTGRSCKRRRNRGGKWWKSCSDLASGSGGWGEDGTNSQSFLSQVTRSEVEWNNVTASIFSVDCGDRWRDSTHFGLNFYFAVELLLSHFYLDFFPLSRTKELNDLDSTARLISERSGGMSAGSSWYTRWYARTLLTHAIIELNWTPAAEHVLKSRAVSALFFPISNCPWTFVFFLLFGTHKPKSICGF